MIKVGASELRMAAASFDDSALDAFCDLGGVLVFPEAQDQPTRGLKCLRSLAITLCGALELPCPELVIGPGTSAVDRTRVPKASVDEHGDLRRSEHEVGGATQRWLGSSVDPVPQPEAVRRGANCHLGARVTTPVGAHRTTGRLRGGPGRRGRLSRGHVSTVRSFAVSPRDCHARVPSLPNTRSPLGPPLADSSAPSSRSLTNDHA